jgi:DNA-binding CsgD family transcriptional regulator/Tfp pilus assembly protein PilF
MSADTARAGAVLHERERALTTLSACLEQARQGTGHAVFIEAEAGLGKTSLLEWAIDHAEDMRIARGRGEPMEQAIPFGLIAQALRSVELRELVGIGRWPVAEAHVPFRQVLAWLERHEAEPLLIALDDIHWADPDSLSLLAFLTRRLARLPVALIGTLRPWPPDASQLARRMMDAGGGVVLHLGPLSERGASQLLAEHAGSEMTEDACRRAWQLSAGNPLLLTELAAVLQRGDAVPDSGAGSGALIEHILLSRFAGLDENGMACARAATVLGSGFSPELAAEVAGVSEERIDDALGALFQSGLVIEDADTARFVHPLFAQALYDDLAPPVRRRMHARAFRALMSRGREARAAEHAIAANLLGDAQAIIVLRRAGRSALSAGATATAVRLLEAAIHLSGDRPDSGGLLDLAHALTGNGQLQDAAETCRRVLGDPELAWPSGVEARQLLGRVLFLSGAQDHGAGALAQAAELALEHDPALAVLPVLDRCIAAWVTDGTREALALAEQARGMSDQAADRSVRVSVEATLGRLSLEAGDRAGLTAIEEVAKLLDSPGEHELMAPGNLTWPWSPVYQVAVGYRYAGHYAEAERWLRMAHDIADRANAPTALATVGIQMAANLTNQGRLREALQDVEQAVEFAELIPGIAGYAHLARAEALAWLGSFEECEAECVAAERSAFGDWFAGISLHHVRGMRLLWSGDSSASEQFLAAEEATLGAGVGEPCLVKWQGHAIRAHLLAGRRADAERVVAWLEQRAATLDCAWPTIAASVGRARLAEAAGETADAEDQFLEALRLHKQTQMPLEHAEALLAYGSFLRRNRRSLEARPHLAEALRLAEVSGAEGRRAVIAAELALAGGRRRASNADRDRPTPAELRVASLAAEGLANAEIARRLHLSVNTVQTHLKHVYSKLGIKSRRQLMTRRFEQL